MFTEDEKKILEDYVTSATDDVFAIKGMEGMVGAAYARYSRAKGGFRETLLKEFIKESKIDPIHANELIERVLIAYGDDSVGELEGAHLSFENISMLATKEIEDRRIGGSPIEQSTRYVFYDQKVPTPAGMDGPVKSPSDHGAGWRYLRHESVLNTPFGREYVATMDFIFDTYTSLIEPMKEYFGKLKSLEDSEYDINGDGKKEKYAELTGEKDQKAFRLTYTIDLRTKACDTLRCLLPLATLTNVGEFGNGRFYQGLISYLLTTDIPEANDIAHKAFQVASKIIPQYVRRAHRNDYAIANRDAMRKLAHELGVSGTEEMPAEPPQVRLLPQSTGFGNETFAAMLFPYSTVSMRTLFEKVSTMTDKEKARVVAAYIGDRKTRRDRPGRALEDGYPFTFELVTNWGVYKDLMRHRMTSQQRQVFTTKLGFDMPKELVDAGFKEKADECVRRSDALYDIIAKHAPVLSQYAVLHGNFTRWTCGMNAREAMHLIELRTTPQGHANYRRVAQMMHREIEKRAPWVAATLKFADHADYIWARGDSEARQRAEEKKLDEKFGNA